MLFSFVAITNSLTKLQMKLQSHSPWIAYKITSCDGMTLCFNFGASSSAKLDTIDQRSQQNLEKHHVMWCQIWLAILCMHCTWERSEAFASSSAANKCSKCCATNTKWKSLRRVPGTFSCLFHSYSTSNTSRLAPQSQCLVGPLAAINRTLFQAEQVTSQSTFCV